MLLVKLNQKKVTCHFKFIRFDSWQLETFKWPFSCNARVFFQVLIHRGTFTSLEGVISPWSCDPAFCIACPLKIYIIARKHNSSLRLQIVRGNAMHNAARHAYSKSALLHWGINSRARNVRKNFIVGRNVNCEYQLNQDYHFKNCTWEHYMGVYWRLSMILKTSNKSAWSNVFWYIKVYMF